MRFFVKWKKGPAEKANLINEDYDRIALYTFLPLYPLEKLLTLQDIIRAERLARKVPQIIIFATHPPCFSLGSKEWRNPQKNFKVPLTEAGGKVFAAGYPVFKTKRGGEVTYHGPGILGCYTIFGHAPLSIQYLFRLYQNVVLGLLETQSIIGKIIEPWPDVWVGNNKVASIGIHYRLYPPLTSFGFNLNVAGDLKPFSYIYPCGIREEKLGVTSLDQEGCNGLPLPWIVGCLIRKFEETMRDIEFAGINPCTFFAKIIPLAREGF